jgi:hypothetical protein
MNIVLVVALAACAPDAPVERETEGRPVWDGAWAVAAGRLESVDGGLVLHGPGPGVALAVALVGAPAVSADGRHVALAHRDGGPGDSIIETVRLDAQGVTGRWVLDGEGSPDRVAIEPSGERVAWVDSAGGVASVFVADFPDGAPLQLTNVDLERTPGRAPPGFVPPPHDGPLRFDENALVWESPDGPQRVVLP